MCHRHSLIHYCFLGCSHGSTASLDSAGAIHGGGHENVSFQKFSPHTLDIDLHFLS
jgi:hypothetical protein